ncbi:MAG: sodium:solute symporter [Sedimentisphaerales bacterium]|nr:sodium:solute symporter [Sedimentisphaerales bacterium]
MQYLSLIDWLIIILYMMGVVSIGFILSGKQKSTKDYFLGGKNIPWWAVGFSIVATETSAATFIGVPGLAFAGNLGFIQNVLGYIIARIFLAIVMVPQYFKGEIYSPYQILARSFGEIPCVLAALFFLIGGSLAVGVRVYMAAIPLEIVLGMEIWQAIFIFGVIATIYTLLGGIQAVIWADVIQFFLLIGGGVFAVIYIPMLLDGGYTEAMHQAREAGKLVWLNTHFTLSAPFNIWMGLIGGTFVTLHSHGAEQFIVQRLLTCKSVNDGRKALIMSAVIIFPLFLLFLIVGALLWVYYQGNDFLISPLNDSGKIVNDRVFPIFIVTKMPHILKGMVLAGFYAAAMSSVDSGLSALSSVSVMDFIKKFIAKNKDTKYYMTLSKSTTVVWAVLIMAIALLCKQATLIFNLAFELAGLTSGPLLGAMLFAIIVKKAKWQPVITGMVFSFFCMLTILLLNKYEIYSIHWPWLTLIGTIAAMVPMFVMNAVSRRLR